MKSSKVIFILFFCISFALIINAKTETKNWNKFGSSWEFKNSKVSTINTKPVFWGYYELTNYNTLLSLKDYNNYTAINIDSEVFDREKTPVEFMISFNITSESQSWLYHLYAFKFTGGFWGIDRVAFITSDRADKSKPFNTKNNTFVKELAVADCKVKYDHNYNYRVEFEENNVTLFINNEKILSAPFPEKNHNGRIAISTRSVKISIDKITIKNGNELIFEDDFNEDTILIKKVKAERIPSVDIEKNADKKP